MKNKKFLTSCTCGEILFRSIHVIMLLNFVTEIIYGSYMVFFVCTCLNWAKCANNASVMNGPLWNNAMDFPYDLMMIRRMYALETWVAMTGLSLYVGITEIFPRRIQKYARRVLKKSINQ